MSIQAPPWEMLNQWWPLYQDFYWRLGILDHYFPVQITSLWRSAEHNRAVGGHPRSQHLLGLASDWRIERGYRDEFVRTAEWLGLVAVVKPTHVHVQRFPAGSLPDAIFADV